MKIYDEHTHSITEGLNDELVLFGSFGSPTSSLPFAGLVIYVRIVV